MARSLVAALLALLTVPVALARGGMPEPLTGRGEVVEGIYYPIFIAATVVFVLVVALMFFVMWRFRANGGAGQATFELERDNLKLEMLWIIVPLIVVLWVGVISYAGLVNLDEGQSQEDAYMTLDVTGYQWTWLADYGSDISLFSDPSSVDGSVGDDKVFKVPADRSVHFRITSGDVIHAWHLMDSNWATVGLVDANPFGPHKYNGFSATLPEGEYQVQCREMCFNPGHGYMRARVEAVPMSDFIDWMEEKGISAGIDLAQPAAIEWDGSAFAGELPAFAAGDSSRAIVTFTNSGTDAVDVGAPGFDLVQAVFDDSEGPKVSTTSSSTVTVAPGETLRFGMDVTAAGDFELRAGGQVASFEVIEAVPISVDLGDFYIDPMDIQLEAGTTYLFQFNNVGDTSHNFFFGTKPDANSQEIVGESVTIDAGASASLLYTPDAAMDFDTWCNVPGHYGLGMFGTMSVQ